jgi:hypothetical protein
MDFGFYDYNAIDGLIDFTWISVDYSESYADYWWSTVF